MGEACCVVSRLGTSAGGSGGGVFTGFHVHHGLVAELIELVDRVGGAFFRGGLRGRHIRRLAAIAPAGLGLFFGRLFAGGGVNSIAIQIAKLAGATVYAAARRVGAEAKRLAMAAARWVLPQP